MIELTVGYVSGFIALAVALIQLCVPTIIVVILVALLRDENSAVTWSVAGRALQSSYWPSILSTDTVACRGVRKPIVFITYFSTFVFILIAVTGIVTPLGLYDAIVLGDTVQKEFSYVRDPSPMGYGTPPRSNLGFTRTCGSRLPKPCPDSDMVAIFNTSEGGNRESVDFPNGYDIRIPSKSSELFGSGTREGNNTVSNVWDIHWRQYNFERSDNINNGSKYLVGNLRQLTSLVLNDAVEPIEGLIVNTKDGGIGFRNHTMPLGLPYGATWSEDLLFIEPETQCVDMNITLDFIYNQSMLVGKFQDVRLTDRGGFTNLVPKYPYYDRRDPQENPDLQGRAYKAAWMHNAYTMLYYNLTNPAPNSFSYMTSHVGKSFPLPSSNTNQIKVNEFTTSSKWGGFLNLNSNLSSSNASTNSLYNNANYGSDVGKNFTAPNPWRISSRNFSDIDVICSGAGMGDTANISNIATGCGMAYGAARRLDGSLSMIFDEGSEWTIPLYSCASAVRAVVKAVTFQVNGTDGLQSLHIVSAKDKEYPDKTSMPVWGVERTDRPLIDVRRPLWGLIAPEFEKSENLSTVRKESLWLPGGSAVESGFLGSSDNAPGIQFHLNANQFIYDIGPSPSSGMGDYTGKTNLAMFAKWQELSRMASTTAKILNLVWTDISANIVIGSKSRFRSLPLNDLAGTDFSSSNRKSPSSSPSDQGMIQKFPVQQYVRQIRYRMLFGIPAFLLLSIAILISITAFILSITGRFKLQHLRYSLRETSAGRLMALVMYPDEAQMNTSTNEWVRGTGRKSINPSQLVSTARKGETKIVRHDSNSSDVPETPSVPKEKNPVVVNVYERESLMGIQRAGSASPAL